MKDSAKPTLKEAFNVKSTCVNAGEKSSATAPKKQQGKKRTAHFGCPNIAAFTEKSGTLFCREHKPNQVQVTQIKTTESKPVGKKKAS